MKKLINIVFLILAVGSGCNQKKTTDQALLTSIIFDTDLGGDVDDAGALGLLNELANRKECTLLAVMPTSDDQNVFRCIDAINTHYGRPDVPIGIRKSGELTNLNTYAKYVAERWPNDVNPNTLPQCTSLYRKLLSGQPDHSIVVIVVGQWQNIYELFHTGGDSYSSLNGIDLFNKKVKYVAAMSGAFPGDSSFSENNIQGIIDNESIAKYSIDRITGLIEFSGYEIGISIKCGSGLNSLVGQSPVADAYYGFACVWMPWWSNKGENLASIPDWATFDQTAVLYAVRGLSDYWTEQTIGSCDIWTDNGKTHNKWVSNPDKDQAYLILTKPKNEMADIIFELMIKKTAISGK